MKSSPMLILLELFVIIFSIKSINLERISFFEDNITI